MSSAVDTSFITGIGSVDERMLILMDIEALMTSADMGLISETALTIPRTMSDPAVQGAGGSIARRVSIIGSVSLALVLLGICAVMSVLLTAGSRERIVTWVGDKTQAVVDSSTPSTSARACWCEQSVTVFKRDFDVNFDLDRRRPT